MHIRAAVPRCPVLAVALSAAVIASLLPRAARAQNALTTWRATEEWRVDGSEAGEPFADIRDMVVTRDGTSWLLSFNDQVIRRYDRNGKVLSSVGRKGSGPGEMRNANGLVVASDGKVWVSDPSNARISVFNANGTFARQHTLAINGYGWRWEAWLDRTTGTVVDPFTNIRTGARSTSDWRHVTNAGVIKDSIAPPSCASGSAPAYFGYRAETKNKGAMSSQYPFSGGGGTAPDGRGAMWCAVPASSRAALVRIGRNDTIAHSAIVLPRVPVTAAERDSAIAAARTRVAKYETNDFDAAKIPTSKPPIALLSVDDDGRLWIQHTRRSGERSTTYDVHDRTGKHLGRLRLPRRSGSYGVPVRATKDALWVVELDDDDVVTLAKYRLGS
ncbi:MAG: hypothetical protein IT353_22675 [Gemmatimonadaceae bacterium]|nr:hypothetical protein [Gemmatimonadaceae bacterium]